MNAAPHIGHMFTAVLCDGANRYHRDLLGQSTFFSIGTDEHGQKVQQKAELANTDTQIFCDDNSSRFKFLFEQSDVGYDRFIRTSEDTHKENV